MIYIGHNFEINGSWYNGQGEYSGVLKKTGEHFHVVDCRLSTSINI